MHMSWQNVLDGNGISITLTGMLIVFSGLLLISFFIARLPDILRVFDRLAALGKPREQPAMATTEEVQDDEAAIMAAIGLVLHMELERSAGDLQKITIDRSKQPQSTWTSAGKMRSLSQGSLHA